MEQLLTMIFLLTLFAAVFLQARPYDKASLDVMAGTYWNTFIIMLCHLGLGCFLVSRSSSPRRSQSSIRPTPLYILRLYYMSNIKHNATKPICRVCPFEAVEGFGYCAALGLDERCKTM